MANAAREALTRAVNKALANGAPVYVNQPANRENNNCNGSGPHTPGEVRVMPHSDAPLHGNDILCRACWNREIDYRIDRNDEQGNHAQDGLPVWATAKVYEG